jgi:2-aminoethylphosphonate-pyruvate transaminase
MDILLNPGPVNISDRVRNALLNPDICHREEEFVKLQNAVRQQLLDVYNLDEDWAAVLLTGSGTAAVEAMLTSLVGNESHVLIIENGVYGERMTRICEIYGLPHSVLHHKWEQDINYTELAKCLDKGITHLALVHHETTTGRLNDLKIITELTVPKNIPIILDAVSSFGAEEIHFADWNIVACAATANKCLHGVPGISFAIVNREQIRNKYEARTLYLDLYAYMHQQDNNGTPFTQSIQVLYALHEALNEHTDMGGWQSRRASYRHKMDRLNDGLAALSINHLIEKDKSSCVLNTYLLPGGRTYKELHDFLKINGFVIYSGQGELSTRVFRLSLMGTISDKEIDRLVGLFKAFLNN